MISHAVGRSALLQALAHICCEERVKSVSFSSGVNGGLAAQRMCTAATWSEDALLEKIDKLSKNKKNSSE